MVKGSVIGIMVTSIEDWRDGRTVVVEALGGDGILKYIRRIVEIVKVYGKHHDAVRIATAGRPGWGRVLGLEPQEHIFHLEID